MDYKTYIEKNIRDMTLSSDSLSEYVKVALGHIQNRYQKQLEELKNFKGEAWYTVKDALTEKIRVEMYANLATITSNVNYMANIVSDKLMPFETVNKK